MIVVGAWLAVACGCGGSSSTPAYTTPVAPDPGPLAISCPPVTTPATSAQGAPVTFPAPTTTGGRAPISVSCTPASGQTFPVGSTSVTCTATDAATSSAKCGFEVAVTAPPRISATKFLAFGDSITAGEVTVPVVTGTGDRATVSLPLQVVPAASYPAVLSGKLRQRYVAQAITMENAGKPGEAIVDGYTRFQTTLTSAQPEALLLLYGYNDCNSDSRAVQRALNTMGDMVRYAKARGAKVYVATLTPGIADRLRTLPEANVLAFNSGIRALAASEHVGLLDLYQLALPDVDGWIGVDGLHPTEAGYANIADAFYKTLIAELETR